jgi:hypothetical protein
VVPAILIIAFSNRFDETSAGMISAFLCIFMQ